MKIKLQHGRHYTSAMERILKWHTELAVEQIAQAIEDAAAGPGERCEDPYCPDFLRHEQRRQDVATVRRAGAMIAAGRSPVIERQPPCPSAVAALAKMEAAALR